MNDKPRGVVHEYWLERRRARLQGRKASGRVGPQGHKECQEKKENKLLDPWERIWDRPILIKERI